MVVTFTEKPLWPSLTPFQIMHKVTVEKKLLESSQRILGKYASKLCFQTNDKRP